MPKFILYENEKKHTVFDIKEIFPFLFEKGHIISLVGAGGKTSLLYYMAKTAKKKMSRVLVTTTTHIEMPQDRSHYASTAEDVKKLWQRNQYVIAGMDEGRKMARLSEAALQELLEISEFTCIEADGSKRLPCKVPGEREPVILPRCDVVIAVLGLSALGRPLEKVCFRKNQAMEFLQVSEEHLMNEEDFAKILSSERGLRKNVGKRQYLIVLNQCDTKKEEQAAQKIAHLLSEKGYSGVISCCMTPKERNNTHIGRV